jgi:hypothetical protein
MPATLKAKIEAEHRLREFLKEYELPQPDEVEYGYWCVRFYYHEPKCVLVFDLDPDADAESHRSGDDDD